MATINERVKAGVELLDRVKPDWRDDINTLQLNMVERSECVLGQVFGDYSEGLRQLGLTTELDRYPRDSLGIPFGFQADVRMDNYGEEEYRQLKEAWLSAIE